MEEALEQARAKDTKERMAAVERLHELLEASRKSLSPAEVTSLVDCCMDLLKDNNFRVSAGGLQALASAAVLSGEHLKLHFNALFPAVVERLGDAKQPVRDAARRLLLTLMEVAFSRILPSSHALNVSGTYGCVAACFVRSHIRIRSLCLTMFVSFKLLIDFEFVESVRRCVCLDPKLNILLDACIGVKCGNNLETRI